MLFGGTFFNGRHTYETIIETQDSERIDCIITVTSQYLFQICIIVRLLTWPLHCQTLLSLLSLVKLSQTAFNGLGQINIHLGEHIYNQVSIFCLRTFSAVHSPIAPFCSEGIA